MLSRRGGGAASLSEQPTGYVLWTRRARSGDQVKRNVGEVLHRPSLEETLRWLFSLYAALLSEQAR